MVGGWCVVRVGDRFWWFVIVVNALFAVVRNHVEGAVRMSRKNYHIAYSIISQTDRQITSPAAACTSNIEYCEELWALVLTEGGWWVAWLHVCYQPHRVPAAAVPGTHTDTTDTSWMEEKVGLYDVD